MRITRLLAAHQIPELRSVSPADFHELFDAAKTASRASLVRWSGWIFVCALVLPFLLLVALPAFLFLANDISLAWIVPLVPLAVLASTASSELGTFWVVYPELCRQVRHPPSALPHTFAGK